MSKVWLITGSARGLGRSILEAALAEGDSIVATARNPERLSDLEAKFPNRLKSFALDVTDGNAANAAVDFAIDTFGRLDVLVNNAGYGHILPFEQTGEAEFRDQLETNFFGVVNLIRAALPHMRQRRTGHIINISSVGGRTSAPGLSAYQSAKWAVGGLTEVLAKETAGFGIEIVAVEPGGMRTDWSAIASEQRTDLLEEYRASVGAMLTHLQEYFGNEIGDPGKVAEVVVGLSKRRNLPAHLLLGSDALAVYAKAEGERQRSLDEWTAVSKSVDIENVDIGFLDHL
ncbi:SDR family NAD(P)-dependent oxidoreductase [Neorhizobium sp. BT27B]|uniref:SDR family NAD(P)-dependent oxidoreductase n=1 Tax=Neorhizobium sp. BT27B TaxID=3142625 RepID=UPI003D2C7C88